MNLGALSAAYRADASPKGSAGVKGETPSLALRVGGEAGPVTRNSRPMPENREKSCAPILVEGPFPPACTPLQAAGQIEA
jgi:hypothetical protein